MSNAVDMSSRGAATGLVAAPTRGRVRLLPSTCLLVAAAAATVGALWLHEAEASHLRGGTLWMEPTGVADEARFGGTLDLEDGPPEGTCYTYGGYGAELWPEGDGPGAAPVTLDLCVLHKDLEGWTVNRLVAPGTATEYVHLYPSPSKPAGPASPPGPWTPFLQSCYRMQYGARGEQVINMQPGSDATVCQRLASTGDLALANRAPRTFVPPIHRCTAGAVCTVPVSAVDPDGDPLAFRIATSDEYAGGTGTYFHPGPPYAPNVAALDAAGVLTWDTAGATMADPMTCTSCTRTLYSVQLVVEDGHTKSPVDFFIELVPDATPPAWATPPTPCGATVPMTPGIAGSFPVRLTHPSATELQVFLDPTTPLPAGATLDKPPASNPLTRTFSWTPPAASVGLHALRFQGSAHGSYAPPCDVTLQVLPPPTAKATLRSAACAGQATRWRDDSAPGHASAPLVAAVWAWGDGTTSPVPEHVYGVPGTYTVRLHVEDALGRTAEDAVEVAVCNPPPTLAPLPDVLMRADDTVQVCAVASDPNGDPLDFGFDLPRGVRVALGDPSCLLLDGRELGPGRHGPILVRISDGTTTASASFQVRVLDTVALVRDFDGDGVGDGADLCPAEAAPGTGCPVPSRQAAPTATMPRVRSQAAAPIVPGPAADADQDGIAEAGPAGAYLDNCPLRANPDQRDADQDGAGDACDPVQASLRSPRARAASFAQEGASRSGWALGAGSAGLVVAAGALLRRLRRPGEGHAKASDAKGGRQERVRPGEGGEGPASGSAAEAVAAAGLGVHGSHLQGRFNG